MNRPVPSGFKVLRWDLLPDNLKEHIKVYDSSDPGVEPEMLRECYHRVRLTLFLYRSCVFYPEI
ncbi:hypothetical protein JCM17380_42760 [Desulfosporosinus burensis]